jgi:hypothetical protein
MYSRAGKMNLRAGKMTANQTNQRAAFITAIIIDSIVVLYNKISISNRYKGLF